MENKNEHAQALGKLGGLARAKTLTADQRLAISQHANLIKKKRAKLRKEIDSSWNPSTP
jgi:hypothetical protein